jgi:hypothetical protein
MILKQGEHKAPGGLYGLLVSARGFSQRRAVLANLVQEVLSKHGVLDGNPSAPSLRTAWRKRRLATPVIFA